MIFEVEKLNGGYDTNVVVNDVSFKVGKGEMIYVLGANGSGKTTMFNMLIGYKRKISGKVMIDGVNLDTLTKKELARMIAFIPQQHVPTFGYLVEDMVIMGRTCHISSFGTPNKNDYNIVYDTLDMLGIKALAKREYTELSGGERQLVMIARAICQQAKIIIMDEPLNGLDFANKAMVTEALNNLVSIGYTIIMSTHNVINNYTDNAKILLMDADGYGTYTSIEDIVSGDLLQKAYKIPIQAICSIDEKGGKHLLCLPL
ncbi:MAG: ABC transporter ATP-binding protein [Clostridiales bacterium]|nr:ABC transporter ATP-binding protein [Clostridiales bacterium]